MTFQRTWFHVDGQPPHIQIDDDTDVRFPPGLPKKFIEQYTNKGDVVFDPFAGYGTTLLAAQELGRIGVGVEYEEKRAQFIASQLQDSSQIIHGDSRKLKDYELPKFDLCFTSPPYMRSFDKENPLTNYHEEGNYEIYLSGMTEIFEQVKHLMNPGAHVLVEMENTFEPGVPMTPLAWDLGRTLSDIFFLEKELIYCHDEEVPEKSKVNHSYVLVFKNH